MKIILTVLFGIFACATAQTPCSNPNEPRQIFVHPTDCSRYIMCVFGREAVYLCPTHINFFNACTMNCTSSNSACFSCGDQTTIGTTTTVIDGTTTTPIDGTTTTPVDGTTTTPVDVTTTAPVTDEPTFIPTPPPETTAGPDTTTTVAGDTTISVPTAPIVPPTPPTNP